MALPTFITHYYEADYGPFLNICDLDDKQLHRLISIEKDANTSFNRFAMGPDFFKWRLAADDLLIRSCTEKFGFPPSGRPFYALLGTFDKTLTMFRNGRKIILEVDDFQETELTLMYPDHAHLVSYYGAHAPALFYQPSPATRHLQFWGKLFTYRELQDDYTKLEIDKMIDLQRARDGWAGCYVEAHIWRRNLRTDSREPGTGAHTARSHFSS